MRNRPTYKVVEISPNLYQLSHGALFLGEFSRKNVREVIESVASANGFSSNWVGSIIHIFNRSFPSPYSPSVRSDFDRFVYKLGGVEGLANYYRSKGFRIVKKVPFTDLQGILYLEKEGYEVEGFIGDVHYASDTGKVKV